MSRLAGCLALITGSLAAFAAAPAPLVPAGTSSPSADAIVGTFNTRALGSPGIRRVRLELKTGSRVTRTFDVVHAWRQDGADIASLVFLRDPAGLRGTSYYWSETSRAAAGLEIFVWLPLGTRQVLALEAGRFDEGLLGSDFSYADLLWRVPTVGRRFTLAGVGPHSGAPAWLVESRPTTAVAQNATAWVRVVYRFAKTTGMLLGAEYFPRETAGGPNVPGKTLTVAEATTRDGVWTPRRLVMSRSGGRQSVLTLASIRLGVAGLPATLFRSAALPRLGRQFEEGAPPRPFAE